MCSSSLYQTNKLAGSSLSETSVLIAGFLVGQPLMPPPGIREIHKRIVLQYFVASPEPLQSSVLKADKTKSGLGALVSADNCPVCVARHTKRRFE
jgi:hypothetical protein